MTAATPSEFDMTKYNFIDFNGDLIYSFTDDEIDAMEVMPEAIDHTDENLTFQEWNWNLEELKSVNRNRPDRPIVGPHYITTDEKTYFEFDISLDIYKYQKIGFSTYNTSYTVEASIDWGDGTVETLTNNNKSIKWFEHTYENLGKYTVVITPIQNGEYLYFGTNYSVSGTNEILGYCITKARFGKIWGMGFDGAKLRYSQITDLNIPKNILWGGSNRNDYLVTSLYSLKATVLPKASYDGVNRKYLAYPFVKTISLPPNFVMSDSDDYGAEVGSQYLSNIYIPDGCHGYLTLRTDAKYVYIPEGLGNKPLTVSLYNKNFAILEGNFSADLFNVTATSPYSLKLSDSIKKFGFYTCPETTVVVPAECTSFGNINYGGLYGSSYSHTFVLDLSKCNFITLTSSPTFLSYKSIIKVPNALLDQYKSASYWSNHADYIIGV